MGNDYDISNSVTEVTLCRFNKRYGKAFLGSGDNIIMRQHNAQGLLNYLCDKFRIPYCRVQIIDKAQLHRTNANGRLKQKTYGRYYPAMMYIEIFNRTAMRNQTVSINVMYDTLLHEFMHHYDTAKMGIKSAHTKGFYMRISDLRSKLGQ